MVTRKMRLSMAMLTIAASMLTTGNIKADEKTQTKDTNTVQSQYANKAVADIYSTTTLNIRKKGSMNAKIVGKMKKGNIATVLKKGDEWSKVRSGSVTGYVKNQYLIFGDEIKTFAKQQNLKKTAKVQAETLRVRKKASTDSKIITLVSEGDKLKVKTQNADWAKVKVDGKTGYISKDYAKVTYSFGKAKSMKQIQAEEAAKEAAKKAKEAAASQKNTSTVSTSGTSNKTSISSSTTSSNSGTSNSSSRSTKTASVSSSGASIGSRIASYAQQFVGNPYRYGGNSLTGGIDCSGFTQQVMARYGYSISRTSSSQATEGVAVSTSNLRAGDLVFYGNGGSINHVALYIGGGQVVHASNSAPYPKGGIKISNVNYRTPICARRIIK